MTGIPKRYRVFRRTQQREGKWYTDSGFTPNEIHPLEVDIVLLAILRAARDLFGEMDRFDRIDDPVWSYLKTVLALYRNQILVDEATDFSPIQLACMEALAHPKIRSFFACGDFNQRLTTWGTRSREDVEWACRDISMEEITVSYRQTRQLSELTQAIMRVTGNTTPRIDLPAHVDTDGLRPVLLEGSTTSGVVDWLARRICEIESAVETLPSTAILVSSEADVQPLAKDLSEALVDQNIRVVACPMGQALGEDNDIRVFDIQHIKGLEFEAVFFISIDLLADEKPTLFDKYLYVGASRAATYLGMTCKNTLPEAIRGLRQHFGADWS
jgi:DNA helicase IV